VSCKFITLISALFFSHSGSGSNTDTRSERFSVFSREACFRSFSGCQTGVEVAIKTFYGPGVGVVRRSDKVSCDGCVVPSTCPRVQILLVLARKLRFVNHSEPFLGRTCNRRSVTPTDIPNAPHLKKRSSPGVLHQAEIRSRYHRLGGTDRLQTRLSIATARRVRSASGSSVRDFLVLREPTLQEPSQAIFPP
jgi:hypothetical protein